jgi:hypothetical protein
VARTNDFGLIGYEDDMSEVIRQENIWGFGQVVAVGLLVFPVLSFFGKRCSNFVILVVSTLLFLDQDLRTLWLESSVGGRLLSQKRPGYLVDCYPSHFNWCFSRILCFGSFSLVRDRHLGIEII